MADVTAFPLCRSAPCCRSSWYRQPCITSLSVPALASVRRFGCRLRPCVGRGLAVSGTPRASVAAFVPDGAVDFPELSSEAWPLVPSSGRTRHLIRGSLGVWCSFGIGHWLGVVWRRLWQRACWVTALRWRAVPRPVLRRPLIRSSRAPCASAKPVVAIRAMAANRPHKCLAHGVSSTVKPCIRFCARQQASATFQLSKNKEGKVGNSNSGEESKQM